MMVMQNAKETKTLREWRAYRRLTKSAMARELGVHPATYARMENNPSSVTIREANLLAEILDVGENEINFLE